MQRQLKIYWNILMNQKATAAEEKPEMLTFKEDELFLAQGNASITKQ
jgi:hypothetical protein